MRDRLLCAYVCAIAGTVAWLVTHREQIDPNQQLLVDAHLPQAIALAEAVAPLCVGLEPGPDALKATRPQQSPALDTALAASPNVVEVQVNCDWPVTPPPGRNDGVTEMSAGTSLPALRGVRRVARTARSSTLYSTAKSSMAAGEQVVQPSAHHPSSGSLDISATRPTPDGGFVEVVVSVVQR